MKHILTITTLLLTSLVVKAQPAPDFKQIFNEIKATNTITDALSIREAYLPQMRTLSDFNILTNLEGTTASESYFQHYKTRMANFISSNVSTFIDPDMKDGKNIFLSGIFPKVANSPYKSQVAELGLSYVSGCEDFLSYADRTDKSLRKKYFKTYCKKTTMYGDLISVLFHPRILEAGRWDKIQFSDSYYVKKIYISAEGIRNDAYFDVLVNGDVKGTIYVPGRDPSYIITVEDYTDSLLLRSLQGNARITSILIDVQ